MCCEPWLHSVPQASQPNQASSWDAVKQNIPEPGPTAALLLSAGSVTPSSPDGDDQGEHLQQDGDDEHHDGGGRRRGRRHAVLQETRDGQDEEDCGGQEHVQQRAEGGTGKRLHWSVPYNLCGTQGLREGMKSNFFCSIQLDDEQQLLTNKGIMKKFWPLH